MTLPARSSRPFRKRRKREGEITCRKHFHKTRLKGLGHQRSSLLFTSGHLPGPLVAASEKRNAEPTIICRLGVFELVVGELSLSHSLLSANAFRRTD
ncbi:MAG: hypothetical protein ACI9G1_001539 [Pirellulaceae bacterium]|jgi:hypothetical protein